MRLVIPVLVTVFAFAAMAEAPAPAALDAAVAELRAVRGEGVARECAGGLRNSADDLASFVGRDQLLDASVGVGFSSTYVTTIHRDARGVSLRFNDGERVLVKALTPRDDARIRAALAAVVAGERRVFHEGIADGSCRLFATGGQIRLVRADEDTLMDQGVDAIERYDHLLHQLMPGR